MKNAPPGSHQGGSSAGVFPRHQSTARDPKAETPAIVTEKDPAALDVIRHSTAHLLAMAVQAIYPTAQVTIGPVIEVVPMQPATARWFAIVPVGSP